MLQFDTHELSGFLWLLLPILQANVRLELPPHVTLYSPGMSKTSDLSDLAA